MNIIAELPISTQISLFALFISVISLIHSVKNSSSKTALIKAEKKTTIYLKLVETVITYKRLYSILNDIRPTRTDCKNNINSMIANLEESIIQCDRIKKSIQNLPALITTAMLETESRKAHELYLRSESLIPNIENVRKECSDCHQKSQEYFNSLPSDEQPEKITCDFYKGSLQNSEKSLR